MFWCNKRKGAALRWVSKSIALAFDVDGGVTRTLPAVSGTLRLWELSKAAVITEEMKRGLAKAAVLTRDRGDPCHRFPIR